MSKETVTFGHTVSLLFLGIRNAVSKKSVLCPYKCSIVLDTSFMGEGCVRQSFALPEHMITVSETDAISRQMYAVSGPVKTERSSSNGNISGQMVHCANDVC